MSLNRLPDDVNSYVAGLLYDPGFIKLLSYLETESLTADNALRQSSQEYLSHNQGRSAVLYELVSLIKDSNKNKKARNKA